MFKKGTIYKSKECDCFGKTRYILPTGRYDANNITYQQGISAGNAILFDSRNYVMDKAEFENNYVPRDGENE